METKLGPPDRRDTGGAERARNDAHFGLFRFDLDTLELTRCGTPIRLQPLPSEILQLLVRQAGKLVTHEQIARHIGWLAPAGQTIHSAISQLRRVLGDRASQPVYLETVPRRGYRFIAPVKFPAEEFIEPVSGGGRPVVPAGMAAIIIALAASLCYFTWGRDFTEIAGTRSERDQNVVLAYLQGMARLEYGHPDSARLAIGDFERALLLEPDFAEALVGEARALGASSEGPNARLAKALLDRALVLSPGLPEAHLLAGDLAATSGRNPLEATEHYRHAVELRPDSPRLLSAYAMHLTRLGRHAEAVAALARAIELDPTSAALRAEGGMSYFMAGDYSAALAVCQAGITLRPDHLPSHWCRFRALDRLGDSGRVRQAAVALMKGAGLPERDAAALASLPEGQARERFLRGQVTWLLDQVDRGSPRHYALAVAYGTLGESDRALLWLQRAVTSNAPGALLIKVDPAFRDLHEDPRFLRLLATAGLTDGES